MGLASFNRMRREQRPVNEAEAQRFKESNELANAARVAKDKMHDYNAEKRDEIAKLDAEANQRIGEKNEIAAKDGPENDPLRLDHAAEIAGRNLQDVDQPKDPVERVRERVPDNTANEKLAGKMSVESEGPTKSELQAAAEELGVTELSARDAARTGQELPAGEASADTTGPGGPVDEGLGDAATTADESRPDGADDVEIPDDWTSWPALEKRALAGKFVRPQPTNGKDAEKVIRAEVARRAGANA